MKPFLNDDRHLKKKHKVEGNENWRIRKKLKTTSAVLVLCLNLGTDPPDLIKVNNEGKTFCWIDVGSKTQHKPIEEIGINLKRQYEKLQPRARYKQCLDSTNKDVKKACISLRKNAKKERVMFHYNGSGVPSVSENGEIWTFNKDFTQYIPLSVYDLHSWMKSPSLYVIDCSYAGRVCNHLVKVFENAKKKKLKEGKIKSVESIDKEYFENIILGATSDNEKLPSNPRFPSDLFTACLTTPIRISLRWFCMNRTFEVDIPDDIIEKIPGRTTDRRTPLGELQWIFTSITDTIAWCVLPRDKFHKLFRQDLLVASLFRNFLLANRIFKNANITPISSPKLPQTYHHPLWKAWDLELDICINKIAYLYKDYMENNKTGTKKQFTSPNSPCIKKYPKSNFFSNQLTEFEIWLKYGKRETPTQLPMLLQVLLSQTHRYRALTLLNKFVKRGSWAVNLALSVGIFPYILKLLQSHSRDLKEVLVSIWGNILSYDKSSKNDLVNDKGHIYFLNILNRKDYGKPLKTKTCFVLSLLMEGEGKGQEMCVNYKGYDLLQLLHDMIKMEIISEDYEQRNDLCLQWCCLTLSQSIKNNIESQKKMFNLCTHQLLMNYLLKNKNNLETELRATIIYTIGSFINCFQKSVEERDKKTINEEIKIGAFLSNFIMDGSPLVRKEVLFVLSYLIINYIELIPVKFLLDMIRKIKLTGSKRNEKTGKSISKGGGSSNEKYGKEKVDIKLKNFAFDLCRMLGMFCVDPMSDVNRISRWILYEIHKKFKEDNNERTPTPEVEYYVPISPKQKDKEKKEKEKEEEDEPTSPINLQFNKFAGKSLLNKIPSFLKLGSPNRKKKNMKVSSMITSKVTSKLKKIGGENDLSNVKRHSTPNIKKLSKKSIFQKKKDDLIISLPKSNYFKYISNVFLKPEEYVNRKTVVQILHGQQVEHQLEKEARLTMKAASSEKLEEEIGYFGQGNNLISKIKIHSNRSLLFSSNDFDEITVWNWVKGEKVSQFTCKDIKGRISDFCIINEKFDNDLLCVTSFEGNVSFYKNYQSEKERSVATAFIVVPEANMYDTELGFGILTEWKQQNGTLIVGGDAPTIRLWDLNKEVCFHTIDLKFNTCVTCLASDPNGSGNTFVGGTGKSDLFLIDERSGKIVSCVNHPQRSNSDYEIPWFVDAYKQKIDNNQVFTGNNEGLVQTWDLRKNMKLLRTINTKTQKKTSVSTFAIHNYSPIFAVGSISNRIIKVYNIFGDNLSTIVFHEGLIGRRMGPISTLCFHPYQKILAAGSTDSIISIYR